MGASRERKKRQEYYANGGVDTKAIREAETKAKQKKFNTNLMIGAGVFAVVVAFLLVFNSGVFQRDKVAVTVGDKEYTAADYSYYYHNIYNGYYEQYGEMASLLVGDLTNAVVDELKFVHAAVTAAEKDGFTLTAEQEEMVSAAIEQLKTFAKNNGMSYKKYVSRIYGKYVTPEVVERNLRNATIANYYSNDFQNSLVYSDEKLEETYQADPGKYDVVNGFTISVSSTPAAKTDADGKTVAATEEEKAAAKAAAKETAEAILADYKAGGDPEALAEAYGATYTKLKNHKQSYGIDYSEWLFEDGRKAGDAAVVEGSSSCFVTVFEKRFRDETKSVDVRHILLTDEESGNDKAVLEQIAQIMLTAWDRTDEGFATLAMGNSKDSGSAANGGLYQNVTPSTNFVDEFLDWCFAEGRKAGDSGIIHTQHGCHIMYLSKMGDLITWQEDVRSSLFENDYAEWENALTEGYTVSQNEKVMNSAF